MTARAYFPRMGARCEYKDGLWSVLNFVPDPERVTSFLDTITQSLFPDGAPTDQPDGDRAVAEEVCKELGGELLGWVQQKDGPPGAVY